MTELSRNTSPRAVVHVDLDGAAQIYRHHGWTWKGTEDALFASGMRNLLGFLEHNGLRATLFVVADDLDDPAKRALIEEAVAAGHEIASHSLTHADFDKLDGPAIRHEIFASKEKLEKELGVSVKGFRTPSYQINREAFEMLAEAGYRWDSSVFPTPEFARRLKCLSLLQEPNQPLLDQPLMELPLPGHKGKFPFHPCYSMILGERHFTKGLRRFRETGAPLVLLFHLTDFSDPLPKELLAGVKSKLFTVSGKSAEDKRARCQRMLDQVRAEYDVIATEDLVAAAHEERPRRLVLGISTTHETGAALYDGHECLAAINEERLDRVKFSTRYPPKLSIDAVIEIAGVDPEDITDVVIAGLPPKPLFKAFLKNQKDDFVDYHGFWDYFPHGNKLLYRSFAWKRSLTYKSVLPYLREKHGIQPRLHHAPHHLCHAASAYRTAPFDDCLTVTADGVGDFVSVTVGSASGGKMKLLHMVPYPHSFGQFYTACTQVLGFRANRHEGKITGLSGYGKPNPELYDKVKATLKGTGKDFKLDKRYYSEGIVRGFSLKMLKKGEDLFEALQYRNYKTPLKKLLQGYTREDVANVFQTLLEEQLVELVRPFAEASKMPNLVLAGGIFANVKANAYLFRELGFDNVYVFPNMGDGGLGSGAALELLQAKPVPFDKVYWGPEYTPEQIEKALVAKAGELSFARYDNVEHEVAGLLAANKVVARFDGRMEYGPRALCNRSILYAANEPEANNWLNKRLGRTEFMPFAPVAAAEHAEKLFVGLKGTEHACKFMTIILDCTDFTKENCPAVVHVDGTARPQLVSPEINEGMHKILTRYEELTGVPLVVNTSFNMHEEPIVCSPEDGVRAFLDSRLDYLAIGPYLACMKNAETGLPDGAKGEPSGVGA